MYLLIEEVHRVERRNDQCPLVEEVEEQVDPMAALVPEILESMVGRKMRGLFLDLVNLWEEEHRYHRQTLVGLRLKEIQSHQVVEMIEVVGAGIIIDGEEEEVVVGIIAIDPSEMN